MISKNIFWYICFLVFEMFQVFHLYLAAVGGWPPAANFTLVLTKHRCFVN